MSHDIVAAAKISRAINTNVNVYKFYFDFFNAFVIDNPINDNDDDDSDGGGGGDGDDGIKLNIFYGCQLIG